MDISKYNTVSIDFSKEKICSTERTYYLKNVDKIWIASLPPYFNINESFQINNNNTTKSWTISSELSPNFLL